MSELPSGTVTFLFTDVEGSTKLLHELGPDRYAEALAEHRRILRQAFSAHDGVEVDTQGDAFFVAFPTAPGALEAAGQALEALAPGPIRVRIGIHTGTPHLSEEGYVGVDVHRAARIAAAGHGGQVLVSASTASLLEPSNTVLLADLGLHRLKDLSAPERIYKLGEDDFPPLKTLYQTNLPVPATPFLGREQELGDVLALLSREDIRLLTLTGPGGTGKTRLGLQVAAEGSERYPDGVFWVPLAPLRDPELVLETTAQALGAKDGLAEHISDKSLLLLFDNFEHVVDAAPGLSELLAACPNLHLLVTSRELLRVPGEQAYPVPPLEPEDGTELFLARARAADPGFASSAAVPELCARLEQLPLALELAAARVRVLSAEQIAERLSGRLDLLKAGRGVDPRQQTLRATIEWSHDLLDEGEQRLFARLAVFAGGCTLEAAEEVCDADLDTLQSLVDKSLVRVREGERFWMLETIREYAAERLEDSGDAEELRRRHAEHYLGVAEEAEPKLREYDQESLDRLEHEHSNVAAALDTLEAVGERELALRLAGAAFWYWGARGHLTEGRRRLDALLAGDEHPTEARAKALIAAADLALDAGDSTTVRRRAEEALALQRRFGDPWGTAYSLFMLGMAAADESEFERAQELFEESERLFREVGDLHMTLFARRSVAWMHFERGDVPAAQALHEDVVRQARAAGDELMQLSSLGALAEYALDDGRLEKAVPMLREVIRIQQSRGETLSMLVTLCRFARALALDEERSTAARLLSGAEALCEEAGSTFRPYMVKYNDETRAMIQSELGDAVFAEASQRGRALTVEEAVALALSEVDSNA